MNVHTLFILTLISGIEANCAEVIAFEPDIVSKTTIAIPSRATRKSMALTTTSTIIERVDMALVTQYTSVPASEITTDDFLLIEHIRIDISNTFASYESLSASKTACTNDLECIGIYEASCRKNGTFSLLKKSFMTSVYGTNCLYKKKIYGDPESNCFDVSMYKPTS